MSKLKAAFICAHNSCRSRMAEAVSKLLAADVYEAFKKRYLTSRRGYTH